MWRAYFAVVLGGTFLLVLCGMLLWVRSDPATGVIDQDIARIQNEIADASSERAKYSGGLVLALIEARSNILRTTESMLQAKRLSWLRRVDLIFTVEGQPTQSQAPGALKSIEDDIRASEQRIAEAEAEAQRYSGGLVQGLALATVATERITRSQLLLAYYSAKYGLLSPLPTSGPPDIPRGAPPEPIPNTVDDKDAL